MNPLAAQIKNVDRDRKGSKGRNALAGSCFFGVFLLGALTCQASESIAMLPGKIKLSGTAAQQGLLVEQLRNGRLAGQITNDLVFSSSDTNIVVIDKAGVAVPVQNGDATIWVKWSGLEATAEVAVEGMEKLFDWSFRNHVQPVLAKAGCSAGACHGAAAGQNGFKLSLRGFDDEGDFLALTHQALGRRIVPSDPGRSLMLLKPTGAVPHKGGKRFEVGSLDYRVLSEWIAAGTPGPKPDEPRIDRLEFLPDHVFLQPEAHQQLSVRAWFTDGHTEDVTHWVKYTSANESVAQVDDNGLVKVVGFGEGAITGWYLSRIAIATVTVPYTNDLAAKIFTKAKRRNFIDELVLEKLQSLNLPPSQVCGDSDFIRRAFLDTIGVLPTAQETREFLADEAPEARRGTNLVASASASARRRLQKRDALIELLLHRPEFVDYWSYKWSDLLLVSSKQLKPAAMWSYYNWIRNEVAANTPWDRFVRELILAQGSTLENGAGNFYVLHDDPRAMAETTTQAFLGMSVNCAKCHNHPMEKWTNQQYYQMANLFARVRTKNGAQDGDQFVFAAASGDLVQPLTGRPQPPAPLDGRALALDDPGDRRVALADWLTSRDNPYFSRAIANRVWANFMGVGLVEKVDDLRVTNPASNEKLLSALARHLADQQFNLQSLMRAILQSESYQRSSVPLPENAADTRFYSRYYPKRLMAEVALDAISQVTGVPTQFKVDRRNQKQEGEKYPFGFRALQLPDTQTDSYFLKSFGRPEREKTCTCERTAEPSITQVLHLANGDTINEKLAAKENRITQSLGHGWPPEQIVEEAYLSAFARFPTRDETVRIVKLIGDRKESSQRPGVEDMYWALLSSREFLFNH